jgi:hypothetical protein
LVRGKVLRLVELGSMPSEDDATVPELDEWDVRLLAVERPVSDEEARLLLGCSVRICATGCLGRCCTSS